MISAAKQCFDSWYDDWIERATLYLERKNARDLGDIGFSETPSPHYLFTKPTTFPDVLVQLWVALVFLTLFSAGLWQLVDVEPWTPELPPSELLPIRDQI